MKPGFRNFLQSAEELNVRNKSTYTHERVTSVDALRGFDMFWIMGGDITFKSLDKALNNKFSSFLSTQMDHVDWFGFHFYDIIMPLFMFLVGVAMVYSYRKRLSNSESDLSLWKHTIKRVLILWILGMVVQGNLLRYDFNNIQFYTNTLQAIASGYLIASIIILYLPVIYQVIATLGLLIIYWAVIALIPVGGTTANAYTPDGNLAFYVEQSVMGRFIGWGTYTWIISTITFGATVMLGVFSGYIMQSEQEKLKKFRSLVFLGAGLIILALLLDIWHPIIKKIWTSSFVLFAGGISVLMLSAFYLLIDVWGLRKGTKWMIILGSNAIAGYVAWHLFDRQFIGMAEVFLNGISGWAGNWYDSIKFFGGFLIIYLILWYMYRNKTFIKI